ncbi:UDP-glucuronosyl/UDP-glucosyltransferase [Parasponia andersonii]|uniref:UDP-glucuronosyl/UDP-glucosyltransferase n=1 Tax=Parasponia andersonii TaxID=3476 RepID=A0A2P5C3U1_PARAD|nr:UDP-glucuronosyl/UDP-glucosyltransferase [Parasponia andersonii]
MVVVPPWSDQGTSAKLIQDVWKTGVRVKHNEDGIVGSEEIKMCLDLVMGVKENRAEIGDENREEMRRINAKKWKDLAREAIEEGGSPRENLKAFVNELITGQTLFLSK